MVQTTLDIDLPTEEHTKSLAEKFAMVLKPGDTLLLSGEIGAGKSYFARSFIRHLLGEDTEVPSPTFTLVQIYETGRAEVWHCDLYRLTQVDEVIELGLDEAFDNAICLVEWPDKLGDLAPSSAIKIELSAEPTGHNAVVTATKTQLERIGLSDE